ncbi:MAG: hypothetical protein KatS3mg102_0506 [Planctomycetota bacterium]|nr:MAG: hypothetical protein KatS3mg102_0506 [Planctomycetota bacterium]
MVQGRDGASEERPVPLLDVRAAGRFLTAHDAAAAHIPLEELARRSHELPRARTRPLAVYDEEPARAARAVELLRARGYVGARALAPLPPGARAGWIAGPARVRLWEPNPWLVACWPAIRERLQAVARAGTGPARALDVACGSGREAVWLAERGWAVEAIDHLPDALARAQELARRCGVRIRTRRQDLEAEPQLPAARYELVCCFFFLSRPLLPAMAAALRPGGLICMRTFDVRERARSGRPRRARFALEPGELAAAFAALGLELLAERAGPAEDGRWLQAVLARRPDRRREQPAPAGPAARPGRTGPL